MGASGEIFRAKKRGKEHMKEQQKKKAAPVLVVLILIVLVGAAGIVSFLINRYKPGTEYMAGNEYFNLTDENSVALIQNGELLEEQAVLIGGEPYAAYTYVESQLNSCLQRAAAYRRCFRAMRPLPKHRADSLPYSRRATERFTFRWMS